PPKVAQVDEHRPSKPSSNSETENCSPPKRAPSCMIDGSSRESNGAIVHQGVEVADCSSAKHLASPESKTTVTTKARNGCLDMDNSLRSVSKWVGSEPDLLKAKMSGHRGRHVQKDLLFRNLVGADVAVEHPPQHVQPTPLPFADKKHLQF